MLCSSGRLLDAKRVATAAKELALTAVAAADSGVAMGLLAVLGRLLARQPKLYALLEHEPGTPAGAELDVTSLPCVNLSDTVAQLP